MVVIFVAAGASGGSNAPEKSAAPPRWILEEYAKKASTPGKGVSVRPDNVLFEATDLNDDGHSDWVIYSPSYCGSAGCIADVYAYVDGRYCYVGWTKFGDAPQKLRSKYPKLECKTRDVPLGK